MKTEIINSRVETYGNKHTIYLNSIGDAMKVHAILAAYRPEIVQTVNGNLKTNLKSNLNEPKFNNSKTT